MDQEQNIIDYHAQKEYAVPKSSIIRVGIPIIGSINMIVNIVYFFPASYNIIDTGGGPEGWGILILPFTIIAHLFFVSGLLIFFKKCRYSQLSIISNIGGLAYFLFLLFFVFKTII